MKSELRTGIESALDIGIDEVETLSGGDINDAYKITTSDGANFFVKSNEDAPEELFQTIGVPRVGRQAHEGDAG